MESKAIRIVHAFFPSSRPSSPTRVNWETGLSLMVVRLSLLNEKDHHYFLNRFVCVGEFFDG